MTRPEDAKTLARALRDPTTFRKKLVLAIALAPPKSRAKKSHGARSRPRGR
jgi:hypothetical protein